MGAMVLGFLYKGCTAEPVPGKGWTRFGGSYRTKTSNVLSNGWVQYGWIQHHTW